MNRSESWIVQRLHNPEKTINPFGNTIEFDNKDSVDRVARVFSTPYMGAAEYEWGALPKAMASMYEKTTFLTTLVYSNFKCWIVYTVPYYLDKDNPNYLKKIKDEELEIKRCIKKNYIEGKNGEQVAKRDYGSFYERINNTWHNEELNGWFDLENQFAWFIDEKMAEEFLLLFKNEEK